MKNMCVAARLAAVAAVASLLLSTPPGLRAVAVAPARAGGETTIKRVTAAVNDIVYDPVGGKLYLSLPSGADGSGNCVIPYDPLTGVYGAPIHVGSEPGPLAVSDNGQYLYVGLQGAAAVRRLNLLTQTPDLFFWLGNVLSPNDATPTVDGPFLPAHLAAIPGRPERVAVSRKPGVAIYENGVSL